MAGPTNFISILQKELSLKGLPPYEIFIPGPGVGPRIRNSKCIRVGRLDGCCYYRMTPRNLAGLICQRRPRFAGIGNFIRPAPGFLTQFLTRPLNFQLNRFSRFIQKEADLIIFQSRLCMQMQERFVGKHWGRKPARIILNGTDLDVFSPKHRNEDLLKGSPSLIIAASFRLHKRVQDAIRITNSITNRFPNAHLHVLGELDGLTQQLVGNLDCSRVTFHGHLDTPQLARFIASGDVGLSPSLFDPCPNTVCEMLASGLPVISTEKSGAAELIGNSELIVPESTELTYLELQTHEAIPQVDDAEWGERIEKVLDDLKGFKERARCRAIASLDISKVAGEYADFICEKAARE